MNFDDLRGLTCFLRNQKFSIMRVYVRLCVLPGSFREKKSSKGHMHQRGSKLIQDQRVFDQANYELNQYK